MSVELLGECKRKLLSSINRLDKILDMYDSTPLEKTLHDTCKADAVLRDTRDLIAKQRADYQKQAHR